MRARGCFLVCLLIASAGCSGELHDKIENAPLSDDDIEGPLLDTPPALSEIGRNALRVYVAPSFGRYHYRIDFSGEPADCEFYSSDDLRLTEPVHCDIIWAHLLRLDREESAEPPLEKYRFLVPEEEFRALYHGLDHHMNDWKGGRGMTLDGTDIAFEHLQGGSVRSMRSNGMEPGNPAYFLRNETHRLVLAYGPTGIVGRNGDWTVGVEARRGCGGTEPFEADPDGYGVGDDPCAEALQKDRK